MLAAGLSESLAEPQPDSEFNIPDAKGPGFGRLSRYELIEEIARGGMGVVYRARDIGLNRTVALKMILSGQFASERDVKRFRAEAEAAARLDHPNIVPIYEVGQEEGRPFFSMKFMEGGTLTAQLAAWQSPLDPRQAASLLVKVARAVHHAHQHAILHRDLKPGNILLDAQGEPHVSDFGLAKYLDSGDGLTMSGAMVGSPSYMSPEQVQSLELTHHSDLYSLGAVMYELLTGIRPFRAGNLVKLLHQIVYATPPPIHTQRKDVPEELEEIVAMAMQKTPDKRQKSGADFAAELTRVHQRLREQNARIDQQEQFDVLRRLRFFHDFSHAEIWEVLRASTLTNYPAGEEIVKEGEMDDRFYILVDGKCTVERHGKVLGSMDSGDCFGETSYVRGARRTATIKAETPVSVLRVSSTLLEQVSAACQLRFNRVFLRALVSRLQGNEPRVE